MSQQQWIEIVKRELEGGPLRFTYDALHIMYILRKTGSEQYPRYHLHVEKHYHMLSDGDYNSLENILAKHPLDRFSSERNIFE